MPKQSDRGPREPAHDFLKDAGFPSQDARLHMKKRKLRPTEKWKWSELANATIYKVPLKK